MSDIKKRDAFHMTQQQRAVGQQMWKQTGQVGRLARSSFDAESTAPRTWIYYANSKGEELATIECELYTVPRHSDHGEAVVMLHGMCPKCSETFTAREDNKTLMIDYVSIRHAPRHIKVNWSHRCRTVLRRRVSDEDVVPVVSSPDRWACDYCKGWCVRVSGSVAVDDHRGVTQLTVPVNVPIIGEARDVDY